jgi:hypothetical protein
MSKVSSIVKRAGMVWAMLWLATVMLIVPLSAWNGT